MEENKTKPDIRFKGFADDWEQRKLGEIIEVNSGKDYKHLKSGNIPVYGTGGYMLSVNDALSFDKDAIGIGRKGTIDKPYILKSPFWTVDTLFYAIPKENYALNFVFGIFQKIDWKSMDESTGVPSLSKATINNVRVSYPNSTEQIKIGQYFSQLDNLITLHQRKCDQLKKLKKTMLKKMFPCDGSSIPEIRFTGFTDDWEQRKLSSLLTISSKKNNGYYKISDILAASLGTELQKKYVYFGLKATDDSIKNYKVVLKNDVIYTKSPIKGFPNGIIRTNKGENGIVPTLYCVYHCKENVNASIIQSYFDDKNRLDKYLFPLVNVGARNNVNITDKEFLKGTIIIPVNFKEQNQIIKILEKLDNLITLHQRKTLKKK